ncbi:FAD-binding oxidoreductase [Chloroflexota bacterium]
MIAENKLVQIVGAGNVNSQQAVLNEYSSDMSFVNTVRPDYVVKPRNTDDVSKIVKLAIETQTPLVPVSSGAPHLRGDTVPGAGGAVVVDLSDMKKIIHIDREARVAMFEPGVTFGELIPAVTKAGLRLNLPLIPRKSKSVVGSLLEREPVILPQYHWDIADPLNCIEIIYGTGDMFRTGAAAGPGTIEEQWAAGGAQVEAAGPSSASWYRVVQGAQGTMGIVTWASARCEILPKLEAPFLVGSQHLDRMIEMIHWLIRSRIANECFLVNNSNLAAMMAKKRPGEYQEIKDSLPQWILFYNVAGYDYLPEERVNGQAADAEEVAQRVGLTPVQVLGGVNASDLLKAVQKPSPDPYWKLRRKGACQEIFFITIHDKLPGIIDAMNKAVEDAGYPPQDMGVYIQPLVQGSNIHCEFDLFYDPDNRKEAERVRALAVSTVNKLMAKGAFFSRPYGESTGTIMNRDAATVATLHKVKNILDPGNIMNPGKLCF